MSNYRDEEEVRRVAELFRKEFLDKTATYDAIKWAAKDHFLGSSVGQQLTDAYGIEFTKKRADWLHDLGSGNVEIIFKHGESPIELIFFNMVNLASVASNLPILFNPPATFPKEEMQWLEERANRANRLIEWYQERHGTERGWATDFLDRARDSGDYSDDFLVFLYHRVADRIFRTRYLTLQASFPEIVPGPFPVRVDAFVWLFDFSLKTVVECDGFAYHKEEHTFIRDRQKDRFFKAEGFDVIRFAGSEIHHDPPECALQLVNQVFSLA